MAAARAIPRTAFLQPAVDRLNFPLKEPEVEEAAMPGQPARTHVRSRIAPGNSPSRIACLPPAHRISSLDKIERSNVFDAFTVKHNVARRNTKTFLYCAEAVDDETSLWKAEEKRAGIAAR